MVIMADWWETACGLSNGTITNDSVTLNAALIVLYLLT